MRKPLLFLLLFALPALADEGMWMPQQMPQLAGDLQKLGFKLDPAKLSSLTGDPLGAVISLGGSCTASFVSPDGLIVTNHHCAFGSIQHNSTPQRDLIANGFLARTREEELPAAPGTKVWVTTNIEDVTGRMKVDADDDVERANLLDRREKELIAECEKPGVRCSVASFFEGAQYLRTTRMELTDIRLVYAPSEQIGDFGGEIDNFEWPRHTGDFAFLRAYANGKPYKPAHWLKVATSGISDGDPVMVLGYPGRTFRYKTADEVRNYQEFVYPKSIRYYGEVVRLLEEAGKNDRDAQIKNASRIEGYANALKNYESVSAGFAKDKILEQRLARESRLDRASRSHDTTLADIAALNAAKLRTRERDLILDFLITRSPQLFGQAYNIARVATERPKKDIERRAKYQQREWPSLLQSSARVQRTLELRSDRAIFRFLLEDAAKLPAEQRIKPIDDAVAAAGGIDPLLDKLYGTTKIGSHEERAKMLSESTAQLKARGDAMIDFALALLPVLDAREERELAWSGAMSRLRPRYFELLRNLSGNTPLYPDANSTLRITFGRVAGYRPKDATWYAPQTTLSGVVEKEKGEEPFASPKALLAAAKEPGTAYQDPELKDVPVNFLSTCDTTGGNSGSPTLNANGELVGLLFDGNYESIDADFLFHEADTRSIHVDIKYVLWIMDAVDHAKELMKELGVR
ncbi:MAG TPA: S46 family peptidase [Thermoanaerobaculia bacterium]|nr:S46 family peptidase [Thermoanaerobaculia bacterium]